MKESTATDFISNIIAKISNIHVSSPVNIFLQIKLLQCSHLILNEDIYIHILTYFKCTSIKSVTFESGN